MKPCETCKDAKKNFDTCKQQFGKREKKVNYCMEQKGYKQAGNDWQANQDTCECDK